MKTNVRRYKMKPISDHFDLAVLHDLRVNEGFAEPLEDGAPVPGCGCSDCTGLPEDHEARQPINQPNYSSWKLRAERARAYPILEIAKRLGLKAQKRGSSWVASCPLHEDKTPSLSISPHKGRSGLWHCFSCDASGDAIELFRRTNHCGFSEAGRELVP